MNMKPYVITIEEINRRTVVIWADDSRGEGQLNAEGTAEDLCNDGTINLDYDDFQSRSCNVQRVARESDLRLYSQYRITEG